MSIKKTLLLPIKDKKAIITKKDYYQGIISSIMFSMIETRPNIAYIILVVSHFAKNLSNLHGKAIKTIFYDLKATKNIRTIYRGEQRGNLIIK